MGYVKLSSRGFLDQTVIEYGWTLPLHHRIYQGQSKYLLRQLALKWMPRCVVHNKKMGFGVPLGHWLRTDLRQWADALLTSESLNEAGFHAQAIRNLWSTHLKEKADFGYRIWNTLMFLYWIQNRKRISSYKILYDHMKKTQFYKIKTVNYN